MPRSSPITAHRYGYYLSSVIGSVWGYIWSTGRVERFDELRIFRGMPAWTFRRGGACIGFCYHTNNNVSQAVLEHELVHIEQWKRYGMTFPIRYLLAGVNPLKNRYEIEAGLVKGGYLTSVISETE